MVVSELFWPMFALFIWTFMVSLRNLQVRISAVRSRQVSQRYFERFEGQAPELVVKTGNHVRNLMEVPPLFYIALLLVMLLGKADSTFLWLAWAYVAFRVLHSLVHLTVNEVLPRLTMFLISNVVLLAIWVRLALFL